MDRYQNDHGQQVLGIELLDSDCEKPASPVGVLEVITDHGSVFVNTRQNERPYLDHTFERYFHDNDIEHSLC